MSDGIPADALDIRVLAALQEEVPLVPRPWEQVAARLGIPESVLLDRLSALSRSGVVRGISPVVESRALGLNAATLVALPVPEDRIHAVAGMVTRHPGVSHNFRRDHRYSLWFTLSARDWETLLEVLLEILSETGFSRDEVLDLPTVQKIKVDVRFPLERSRDGGHDGQG